MVYHDTKAPHFEHKMDLAASMLSIKPQMTESTSLILKGALLSLQTDSSHIETNDISLHKSQYHSARKDLLTQAMSFFN